MSGKTFRDVGGVGVDGVDCVAVRHAACEWRVEHTDAETGEFGDECVSTGEGYQGKI